LIDAFEAQLARTIARHRGSSPIHDMIAYHFGYDAPARGGRRSPRTSATITAPSPTASC